MNVMISKMVVGEEEEGRSSRQRAAEEQEGGRKGELCRAVGGLIGVACVSVESATSSNVIMNSPLASLEVEWISNQRGG